MPFENRAPHTLRKEKNREDFEAILKGGIPGLSRLAGSRMEGEEGRELPPPIRLVTSSTFIMWSMSTTL
jgi:hypothetical protein